MQKFLAGWIAWQLLMIGVCAANLDNHRSAAEEDRTVDCSSMGYKIATTVIDIAVPLYQFTDIGTRDCTPGTNK